MIDAMHGNFLLLSQHRTKEFATKTLIHQLKVEQMQKTLWGKKIMTAALQELFKECINKNKY